MASKKVNIVDNTNEVSVTNSNNKIEIVNTNTPSNIEVTQRTTTLVQVNAAGPKGDRGPIGPAVSFDSGSYVTTGSFNSFTSSYNSGSFSGSFFGDGSGLTNIPASGIVGLNLSQIASGSVSASISPNNGFVVNTNIDASGNITILGDLEADNFSTNGITRVGTESGDSNSGDLITVLGYQSGKNNTGRQIVSVGYQSATDNSANYVSVLGYRAGYLNTGIYLSSVGYAAGRQNTGANQSSLGYTAGYINTGDNITVVGYQAGRQNSGNNIVAIGHQAGYLNTLDNQFIVRHSTANTIPLIQGNFESGSIGIGLTLPQSNLHVAGDIWASGSNGHITASGNISSSATITANAFVGEGSGILGIISASYAITASHALNTVDTSLFVTTGSFNTFTGSINSFTSSIQSEVDNLTLQTGSYATTGSNNFVGNQVITGSLTVSGSSTFTNIGPAIFTGTSTFTNITASGNISASGNVITTEVTASKITSGDSNLILGYAGSNNIDIQNNSDLFINSPDGGVYIESRDGPILEVTDVITLDGNVIATSNITASGNISSSGNIIANQIDTTQITGNPSQVTLGYTGDNQIILENGGDLFINALGGGIEIESGDGTKIGVSDGIYMYNVNSTYAFGVESNALYFGVPVTQLISNTFLSSSNVIATNITASALTSGDGSLILGYDFSNNITIEDGGDLFINAPDGQIEAIGSSNTQLLIGNTIQLKGSGSSPGITIAASSINLYQHVTASGNISSSGTITGTTGSFNHIIGTVANVIWTIDFTDGELSTRLYAPYNLSIDSVTNITGSPTTSITSSGSPYTLGNAITIGTAIDVTSSISSVINLNITR